MPNSYPIQLLAPAYDEDICPHWAERWEIRTHPLGCQVSTITTLTALVTIASTLAVVFFVVAGVLATRFLNRRFPGWWKPWRYDWRAIGQRVLFGPRRVKRTRVLVVGGQDAEREPLIPR